MREPPFRNQQAALSATPSAPTLNFDLELIRTIANLARTPRPSSVFEASIRDAVIPVSEVQKCPGVQYGDLAAFPIFVTPGWRNVPGAVFNYNAARRLSAPFYEGDRVSSVETVVIEACRNVVQHGSRGLVGLRHGMARFAPGAVFLKHLVHTDSKSVCRRALLCMVSDEGPGMESPSLCILNGVGGIGGDQHQGMRIEVSRSLVTLIKSRNGQWFLYDGLHHNQSAVESGGATRRSPALRSQGIKPLAELDLPGRVRGCQKIFLFAHPEADRELLFKESVRALTTISLPRI